MSALFLLRIIFQNLPGTDECALHLSRLVLQVPCLYLISLIHKSYYILCCEMHIMQYIAYSSVHLYKLNPNLSFLTIYRFKNKSVSYLEHLNRKIFPSSVYFLLNASRRSSLPFLNKCLNLPCGLKKSSIGSFFFWLIVQDPFSFYDLEQRPVTCLYTKFTDF